MQEADDSIPKSTISGKPPTHPNSDHTSGSDCSADHAKCKYCSTLIGCLPKNVTTCLKNHVQRCKKFPANLDRTQKMIELDAEAIEGDNGMIGRIAVPSLWQYSQDTCREALALMIILDDSRYVTCNTCVHHVFAIGLGISELCINEDEGVRKMAQQMKLKYDKYWGDVHNMNYLLFVSLLLDPRRKMQLVDWLIRQSFDATKAAVVNVNLMLLIGELFGKYASLVPKVQKEAVSSVSKNLSASCSVDYMDFTKLMTARFQIDVGSDDINEKKTELDKYLEEAREADVEDFNILNWWRDNQKRYPILSKMARDVLAIPVTSVASESAFSTGGRVLDSFRTSLTPKMVEVLICTQDWKRKTNARVMVEESLIVLEQMEEGSDFFFKFTFSLLSMNIYYAIL
ncbi:hypothetical protein V2J09_022210 [Rumex salicifolius]